MLNLSNLENNTSSLCSLLKYSDGTFQKTQDGKQKGIMVSFWKDNEPIYEYTPLDINEEDFELWNEKMFEKHEGLTWCGNTYWYLKTYSCISVPFCKLWFDNAVPYFESIWKDIKCFYN